ncbi:MAG TPA: universal stress protein, partial [Micavibrio sp.]
GVVFWLGRLHRIAPGIGADMSDNRMTMRNSSAKRTGRRGDGGTYLVVADESDEFNAALRYAVHMARKNRGRLGIVYVIDIKDVQQWNNIESMMRRELREQAEKYIWNVAKKANDLDGTIPALYIGEGSHTDVLTDLINGDSSVKMLVLGGGTSGAGPGPLVSYFTGKGLGRLKIPVLVVPGHLESQKIEAIS